LALDAEGLPHILVPLAEGAHVSPDRRSAGVHIVPHQLEDEGQLYDFLDVACQTAHVADVFVHLAEEMLEGLRSDPAQPEAACRIVLSRWRELLEREAQNVLSLEALAGLFGELWHLREIAKLGPGALDSWVGPTGAVHDFAKGKTDFEVKTTLQRAGWTIEVHGLQQLSLPLSGGQLYLAAMRLDPQAAEGESVPDIVNALRNVGLDARELLSKMARLGYDHRDVDHYRGQVFGIVEQHIYHVDVSFPAVTKSSFREGLPSPRIVGLSYLVDLTDYPAEPLDSKATAQIYLELSS
jgi:hypothetical protein